MVDKESNKQRGRAVYLRADIRALSSADHVRTFGHLIDGAIKNI